METKSVNKAIILGLVAAGVVFALLSLVVFWPEIMAALYSSYSGMRRFLSSRAVFRGVKGKSNSTTYKVHPNIKEDEFSFDDNNPEVPDNQKGLSCFEKGFLPSTNRNPYVLPFIVSYSGKADNPDSASVSLLSGFSKTHRAQPPYGHWVLQADADEYSKQQLIVDYYHKMRELNQIYINPSFINTSGKNIEGKKLPEPADLLYDFSKLPGLPNLPSPENPELPGPPGGL